ncbi:MAG: Fic family protein [Proteobacteria bacterium]|nr:Fic family protein [Pseudomonadota bacterium]
MRREDFKEPLQGELVTSPQGVLAFVPAPLPPALAFDAALVRALSAADTSLAELSGMGRQVPNPHLLMAPYMRQEAVLSSRIEGTQASLSDLFEEELRPAEATESPADADAREVRNYVRALEHGLRRLGELPLSLRLVRELHETLMQGVRGGDRNPGVFRTHQNFIGTRGSRIETATFVPPPPDRLPACLDAWEKFLHQRDEWPDLIQCALMHAQFETIHPFADGNGRVGRLLVTLFLLERRRLPQPLLYLSAYIEANKTEYYERLQRTRTHGDWRGWLLYFLEGVEVTARLAAAQVTALIALRDTYRARFAGQAGVLALIDALFANPITDAKRAAREMKKSDPTARNAIAALQAAGWLREVTGRRWGRWFVAHEIVELLHKPEADLRAPQILTTD